MPTSKSKRRKKTATPQTPTRDGAKPLLKAGAGQLAGGADRDRFAEALAAFNDQDWRRAATLLGHILKDHPDHLAAHKMAAAAWAGDNQPAKSVRHLRRLAELEPDNLNGLIRLSHALIELKEVGEAELWLRKALEKAPENATVLRSLGAVLRDTGQLSEAVEVLRRGIAIDPRPYDMESGLIFCLDFVHHSTTAEQQAERRSWSDKWVKPHVKPFRHDPAGQDPERRLKVGYVSGDFRQHSAARCFGPVLLNHDHEAFEVHCYHNSPVHDDMTRAFRAAADGWHPSYRMKEQELFEQVQADGIDILVDLSGFTLGNRLGMFSGKPAPLQVTAWGHAHGVGMESMDVLFSDAVCVPASERPLIPELVWDLPCLITFDAPKDAPEPGALPMLARGYPTFGCFNRVVKVTDESLALFARVLEAVPGSRLVFKAGDFDKPGVVTHFRKSFERLGVARDRVDLIGSSDRLAHMKAMSAVDIALDPIPHGGGVTTFETLWQGVPVLTLRGQSIPGRVSAAIATACGLGDWVADSAEDYIALAKRKSADDKALADLRAGLRVQVAASDAVNPQAYAGAVERAYRTLWRRWCRTGQVREALADE
ncbi:MAG: hypothetical protein ACPGNT_07740 [Rhodospirillales bacterium]